jgi:hypothetical protein
MSMARFIIDFPDTMTPFDALSLLRDHIREGKVSEAGGVKHDWVRVQGNAIQMVGQKSDSFLIREEAT